MTIRRKLILLYSGLLGLALLAFGAVAFSLVRSTWIESVDSALRESADQVIRNSTSYLVGEFGSPNRIEVVLPELDAFRASGVMVQAWSGGPDNRMELDAESENLRDYTEPLDPNTIQSELETFSNVRIAGSELRVMTQPFRLSGQPRALGSLQLAISLDTFNLAINRLSAFLVLLVLAAVAASVMVGTWLSNQSLRPIEAITKAADSIATEKDLSTRLKWRGPMDELGRLTLVFNRMMDRLEHLFIAQTRLVADISHELRTPLTTIRGNLELAQRYGVDAEMMDAIQSEASRMSRLVDDLLLLARADYGNLTLEKCEIDLDTVVMDVVKDARHLARDRDLLLKVGQLEPIRMQGNSDRMKQLLFNLMGNAIKFTPDGGSVTVRLWKDDQSAHLQVSDTGIGIQPEDLPHVFNRFYQADSSRTRTQNSSGAGLGLAIAKWVAEAHGGQIEVSSTPGVQTSFTVTLPLDTAPASTYTSGAHHRVLEWSPRDARLDVVQKGQLPKSAAGR